jgi:glycogen synthase
MTHIKWLRAQFLIPSSIHFVTMVIELYEKEYLRPPHVRELEVILNQNEARGFTGMIRSIDCMHWEWKNYPTS